MQVFTYNDLMQLPSRYRGVLLNKVSGLKLSIYCCQTMSLLKRMVISL